MAVPFFLLLLGVVSYFMEYIVTSRLCMHLLIFHVYKLFFFNSQRWYQMRNCCDLLTRQARSWQYHLRQLVMGFSILTWPKCTLNNVIRNRTFQVLRYCKEVYVREVVQQATMLSVMEKYLYLLRNIGKRDIGVFSFPVWCSAIPYTSYLLLIVQAVFCTSCIWKGTILFTLDLSFYNYVEI